MHIAFAGRQFKACFRAALKPAEKYPHRMPRSNRNIDPAFNRRNAKGQRRAGI
jgi:hypothetical protein